MKRAILLVMVLPLLAACAVYKPLQIVPAKKGAAVSPRFAESYYYFDRDRDAFFVMRTKGEDGVEQVLTMRVFWLPKGGVTTLNPSAVNATFRYIVMTPGGGEGAGAIGMYEGSGFVRMNSKLGEREFEARVAGGDIRLTQASASLVDVLGRGQIEGTFSATYDDVKAAEMLREVEQEFFARSLKDMPMTRPAETGPASKPASGDGVK